MAVFDPGETSVGKKHTLKLKKFRSSTFLVIFLTDSSTIKVSVSLGNQKILRHVLEKELSCQFPSDSSENGCFSKKIEPPVKKFQVLSKKPCFLLLKNTNGFPSI